jgi:hypothetical protein
MNTRLPPDHPQAPKFWMAETSGVLLPSVERFLLGKDLDSQDIANLRAYIRQWIFSPVWEGPDIDSLRDMVDSITSKAQLHLWVKRALEEGIDPF